MFKNLLKYGLILLVTFISCSKDDQTLIEPTEEELKEYYQENSGQDITTTQEYENLNFDIEWSNYSKNSEGNIIVPIRMNQPISNSELAEDFHLIFELTNGMIKNVSYRHRSTLVAHNQFTSFTTTDNSFNL